MNFWAVFWTTAFGVLLSSKSVYTRLQSIPLTIFSPSQLTPPLQPCGANREYAKSTLFPSDEELGQKLKKLCDDSTEPESHTAEGTNVRLGNLKRLMEEAEPSDNEDIKRSIAFWYTVENFLDNVHNGLRQLREADGNEVSDLHKLVQYRRFNNGTLQLIFDQEASKKSKEGRKTAWLWRFLANITRLVHRALDERYSETGNPDKENALRRNERVAKIIIKVVHLLVIRGVREAHLISAALRGR